MVLRTLILANLTKADFDRLHKARISYSGSTGHFGSPEAYGKHGFYIATYPEYLIGALDALKWKECSVEVIGDSQLVISRVNK